MSKIGLNESNVTVIIGKDAPSNTLYLYELSKLIQHRIRCQDSRTDSDVDKLHKMAMEALKIGGN